MLYTMFMLAVTYTVDHAADDSEASECDELESYKPLFGGYNIYAAISALNCI